MKKPNKYLKQKIVRKKSFINYSLIIMTRLRRAERQPFSYIF